MDGRHFQLIKDKVEYYNRTLRLEPTNVSLWIEWVEFQPRSADQDFFSHTQQEVDAKKPSQRAIADIQLSILEKALKKNPASVELHVKQLELMEQRSDKDEVVKQWKTLLFRHPNNPDLWLKYLSFRCSNTYLFNVSSCVKAYVKCLSTLSKVASGQMPGHPPHADTLSKMIGRSCWYPSVIRYGFCSCSTWYWHRRHQEIFQMRGTIASRKNIIFCAPKLKMNFLQIFRNLEKILQVVEFLRATAKSEKCDILD